MATTCVLLLKPWAFLADALNAGTSQAQRARAVRATADNEECCFRRIRVLQEVPEDPTAVFRITCRMMAITK